MGYAFISYSSKNLESAEAVRELFKKHNISMWMAPYDIPAGSKYAAAITKAIRECSCFVLLLTNDSQASDAVDSEVELAKLTFKRPIVTLELEDVELNDAFTFYVHNTQIIPVHSFDESSYEIKKVLEGVKGHTGETEPAPVKVEKAEVRPEPVTEEVPEPIWRSSRELSDFDVKKGVLEFYAGKGGDVVIPNGVVEIGGGAFSFNKSVTSVTLPDSVTKIGESAFRNCENLTEVRLSDNIAEIGAWAFAYCEALVRINVPESANVSASAFLGCANYNGTKNNGAVCEDENEPTITFEPEEERTVVFSSNKRHFKINNGVLEKYTGKSERVQIPDTVKEIGQYAFENSDKARTIIIPNSVTTIGFQAFGRCEKLTSVIIPNSVISIDKWVFDQCKSLAEIALPEKLTSVPNGTFAGCESLEKVHLPDNVAVIEDWAFSKCRKLSGITLPDSVTEIGMEAFSDCSGLKKIVIPHNVKAIGMNAFSKCGNLEKVIIMNPETQIGSWAFYGCEKLTICAPKNSTAEEFAEKNHIEFEMLD